MVKTWNQRSKKEKKLLKSYRAKRDAEINRIKKGPCKDCGGRFRPECMDFDHVPGRGGKIKEVSKIANLNDALLEIAKCDLVCSNCHRVRSRKRQLHLSEVKKFRKRRIDSMCDNFMLENEEKRLGEIAPVWYVDKEVAIFDIGSGPPNRPKIHKAA